MELERFVFESLVAAGAEREIARLTAGQVMMLMQGAIVSRQVGNVMHAARVARPLVESMLRPWTRGATAGR